MTNDMFGIESELSGVPSGRDDGIDGYPGLKSWAVFRDAFSILRCVCLALFHVLFSIPRSACSVCLALLLAWSHACPAAEPAATPSGIPETKIAALQTELAEAGAATSTLRKRRAYKSVARNGEGLLETSLATANRWRVLGIVFQARTRLLGLDNSDRNREALLETCAKLAEAPDEHAELRLEADLLLSEMALSTKGADVQERTRALEELIKRYQGTPAQAKSLIMASQIALKLGALDLKKILFTTMRERFPAHHAVIQWRRKHAGAAVLEVMFAGSFERVDGVPLNFPLDLMGHLSIMVFWSQDTPGVELYLKQVKELEVKFPGRFDVFSFNLDELPDGGMATLRKMELDWTVMRLPGGRNHPAFRSYAQNDPAGIFVNAYGRAALSPKETRGKKLDPSGRPLPSPEGAQGETFALDARRISDERYLAQLQSLFIGDFLVTAEPDGRQTPKLAAIQECFIAAPFRYRLKPGQALANYTKAAKLCADAIKTAPKADIATIRNRRIIALMGMWNLAREPAYLAEAVEEAKAALAMTLPPGADLVARFCLAKDTLRTSETVKMEAVVSAFLADCGGSEAPASAVAAAAILALDANARGLHERTRATLLAAAEGDNPMLWPVVPFLRDRVHTYKLLRANLVSHGRQHERQMSIRGYISNPGGEPRTDRLPEIALKTLDGGTLSLPQDTKGKLTLLVFVEPSAEPNAEFPIDVGEEVKVHSHNYLQFACDLADRHVNKDITTIAAFLSEDAQRIDALMKTRKLTCQAAIVPGGLANPMVRRLGVLSADRIPNVYLLRRDGSIAWHASGLPYEDSEKFVNLLASKVQIEICEMETACQALEKGNFKEAARVFGGPYLPWNPDRFGWRGPRYHGQAVAYMGLKDWDAALESIEKAIDAQKLRYFQGRRDKNPEQWRKEAATVTINNPDDTLVELWDTKAEILDKLGRRDEAAKTRKRAAEPVRADVPSVYKAFHERLKDWSKQHRMETQK
jgi:tetratricopeptide (TPR) repeat protein